MEPDEKPDETEPETKPDDSSRESKAWPPSGLQNKSMPKPSGEK